MHTFLARSKYARGFPSKLRDKPRLFYTVDYQNSDLHLQRHASFSARKRVSLSREFFDVLFVFWGGRLARETFSPRYHRVKRHGEYKLPNWFPQGNIRHTHLLHIRDHESLILPWGNQLGSFYSPCLLTQSHRGKNFMRACMPPIVSSANMSAVCRAARGR